MASSTIFKSLCRVGTSITSTHILFIKTSYIPTPNFEWVEKHYSIMFMENWASDILCSIVNNDCTFFQGLCRSIHLRKIEICSSFIKFSFQKHHSLSQRADMKHTLMSILNFLQTPIAEVASEFSSYKTKRECKAEL